MPRCHTPNSGDVGWLRNKKQKNKKKHEKNSHEDLRHWRKPTELIRSFSESSSTLQSFSMRTFFNICYFMIFPSLLAFFVCLLWELFSPSRYTLCRHTDWIYAFYIFFLSIFSCLPVRLDLYSKASEIRPIIRSRKKKIASWVMAVELLHFAKAGIARTFIIILLFFVRALYRIKQVIMTSLWINGRRHFFFLSLY